MSSISVISKIKTLNTLNNRNVILIILAALVSTLVVLSAISVNSRAAKAFDYNAYLLHRQGEWASVAIPAVDLTAYYQSERTMVIPSAGLACISPVDCR
jgi:hypothetical protein